MLCAVDAQETLAAELETTRHKITELSSQLAEKSKDLGQAKIDLEVIERFSKV